MKEPVVNEESAWARTPMWNKRLNGFVSFLAFAFVSLVYPVEADKAMYMTLREQFRDR